MKFEHTSVMNFANAFRGMRNPMNSWAQSDSYEQTHLRDDGLIDVKCIIGKKDMELAKKLIKAGSDHRKFLRQILVSVDMTAPLYWWKEFDTYKVGTVANSTSTMHKLASTMITMDCFETDDLDMLVTDECGSMWEMGLLSNFIPFLEELRCKYLSTNDTRYWKELIRWLPESWLQTRTVTMSYENLNAIYMARKNHKLSEWSQSFCSWVKTLPYAKELITSE